MSPHNVETPEYTGPDRRRPSEDELTEVASSHPSTAEYVGIAGILTVLTLMEVGVFYIPAFGAVLAPVLIVLSAAKMVLVVGFYMHLKNDANLFSVIFLLPFFLALFVALGLMFLFGAWWL